MHWKLMYEYGRLAMWYNWTRWKIKTFSIFIMGDDVARQADR